jgi:hypothetical protein
MKGSITMFEFYTCKTEEEAKEKAAEFGWESPKIEYDDFFCVWIVSTESGAKI